MADLTKTVAVIFTGEDRASSAAQKIDAAFDGLNTSAASATTNVDKLNNELGQTGAAEASINRAVIALRALATSSTCRPFARSCA